MLNSLKVCGTFIACCALLSGLFSCTATARQSGPDAPKILMVTAHPDDDALFSGTIYKTTQFLGGKVDLALATNGEGGYKYSTLGESWYGLKLTDEAVGREYLPGIRKQELMAGGKIVGLRNYFFLEEQDKEYTQNIEEVFATHWDTSRVKSKLRDIFAKESYDFVFVMLPTPTTHGHHKAAAIMAMEVVNEMPKSTRPLVFSTTIKTDAFPFNPDYTGLDGYPITKVADGVEPFTFDRLQTFGLKNRMNYQIIANWVIAEHKSQGTMQMLMNRGKEEVYYYLDFNDPARVGEAKVFFEAVNASNFDSEN